MSEFGRDLDLPPFPRITDDYLPENVLTHFHLGPHARAEHLSDAHPLLKEADVYVPELSGSHPAVIKELVPITKGNRKSLDRVCGWQKSDLKESNIAFFNMIFGSWKPIALVDTDHARKDLRLGGHTNDIASRIGETIDITLQNYADGIAKEIRRPALRDRVIVEELGPAVTAIVADILN